MHRRVRKNQVVRKYQEKQPHLYGEANQVAGYGGHGYYETGKIHLAEHVRVFDEGFAGLVQAFRKIGPQANACEVKERLR